MNTFAGFAFISLLLVAGDTLLRAAASARLGRLPNSALSDAEHLQVTRIIMKRNLGVSCCAL